MKTARLVLLLSLFLPALAGAKCAWTWTSTWNQSRISPNDWIVVYGGGDAMGALLNMQQHAPRLVSQGHEVPLRVMATHQGQMNRAQAVLKPASPLRPGQSYKLALNEHGQHFQRLEWHVQNRARGVVSVLGNPRVTDTSRQRFGCGPAVHIELEVPTQGETLGFLVEVTDQDGKRHRYMLPSRNGQLSVGHGMCSGAFKLRGGQQYEIRVLSALTPGGRTIDMPRHTLKVTAP